MSRWLYSAVIYSLLPLLFLRLWLKGRESPNYRKRWAERLGFFAVPDSIHQGICFHCVSVGETIAAIELIKQIKQHHAQLPITITSTTPTGSDQVKATFADSVFHVYLPFDTPTGIHRFFSKLRPQLLVIMETELWPNLLHFAKQFNCKTILANARLSAKSAAGYQKITSLSRQMMQDIHLVAAHHEADGQRFIELGLLAKKLVITGSVKFDIAVDEALDEQCRRLKGQWANGRPVWVAGSTHLGEDELILTAFSQILSQYPDVLLVLVPRHPERFNQVSRLVKNAGLKMVRRSNDIAPSVDVQVVLGDTMGELKLFWGIADIAFVGGSLVPHGGHNPLEPAIFAAPMLSGPHVFNFKQIYTLLEQQQAVIMTPDVQHLGDSVIHLLNNKEERLQLGANGAKVVAQNRGALSRLLAQILPLVS